MREGHARPPSRQPRQNAFEQDDQESDSSSATSTHSFNSEGSDQDEDRDIDRQAMLAALEAHGRAFMGNAEAGPSRLSESQTGATRKRSRLSGSGRGAGVENAAAGSKRKRSVLGTGSEDDAGSSSDSVHGDEEDESEDENEADHEDEDEDEVEWHGFQEQKIKRPKKPETIPTVVFDSGSGRKVELSKADRKKFMSAKSSKMLEDEDFALSSGGKKRKSEASDDEDRSNAALDKTLQNMLMTNLLAGAANPTRPVEKRNALKGRLMELSNVSALGRGETEAHEKAYDSQPLRIRSGIRSAQSTRAAQSISDARAAGSYSNKYGGLSDGAGAGRARTLANKVEQGKKEERRERDRGLGMGIGKFKGGMLTLSKKEVRMGAEDRSGGNKKPGKKGKGKKGRR